MKRLAFVITLLVFVFSVVGLYSAISDVIAERGQFILSRILLCAMGIMAFAAFMSRRRIFALLNTIWFLPQIIVLSERFVDPLHDAYAERTIYDLTLSISSVFVIGFEKAPDVFLRIGLNLVGIAGFILSLMVALALLGKGGKEEKP
jgi:hypothetical protein